VLEPGGNAVDAAVAAALAAAVAAIPACSIGGYGGHMVIAIGGKVTAIDFDTAAPRAARPDMFSLDANGAVRGDRNSRGWLSAGVPGTLAVCNWRRIVSRRWEASNLRALSVRRFATPHRRRRQLARAT